MDSFKIPTPESMIQLGYDCGLTTVTQAYSCLMNHYDAFFLIEQINEQVSESHNSLVIAGLAEAKRQIKLIEMSIEDAAKLLNYTFKDDEHPDLETELGRQEFDFDPFEQFVVPEG